MSETKSIRDQLREVLRNHRDIKHLVIAYKAKGKKAEFSHNFETKAEAIAFINEALRMTDEELLKVFRGRL